MITNYNEYINNKLNENIFSSLKSLFGKMLKNVSDDIKKPIDELTAKLNKAKDIDGVNRNLKEYLKIHYSVLTKTIDEAKSINDIVNVVNDNISVIYASIDAAIKSQGGNVYSFEELFKDSSEPLKALFGKNEKRFMKKVKGFSKNLILIQGKPFGINKTNIESTGAIESQEIDATQAPIQETVQGEEVSQGDEVTVENFNNLKNIVKKWFDNKLYKPIKNEMATVSKDKPKDESSTTTKNTEGVKKMMTALQELKGDDASIDKLADSISQLSDPKQLATVRELLVKMGKGTADEYGKF